MLGVCLTNTDCSDVATAGSCCDGQHSPGVRQPVILLCPYCAAYSALTMLHILPLLCCRIALTVLHILPLLCCIFCPYCAAYSILTVLHILPLPCCIFCLISCCIFCLISCCIFCPYCAANSALIVRHILYSTDKCTLQTMHNAHHTGQLYRPRTLYLKHFVHHTTVQTVHFVSNNCTNYVHFASNSTGYAHDDLLCIQNNQSTVQATQAVHHFTGYAHHMSENCLVDSV